MAKKSSMLLVSLMLVFSTLLSACGGSGDAPKSESQPPAATDSKGTTDEGSKDKKLSGEITVWVHPYVSEDKKDQMNQVWDGIIASYNKKYPDVKVNMEEIPWANREQKILTALAANNGPDVFYQISDQIPQFASKGVLEPFGKYLDDADMQDFTAGALSAGQYNGEQYALPVLQESQTLIYNTDIIKAIGEDPNKLPTTWEEFNVWAEKAAAKGYYARDFGGGNACCNATLYPILWQQGGDVLDKDGNIILNNAEGVATFQLIKDMYDKNWIPKDSISNADQFPEYLAGKMMAIWGSGYSINVLKEQNQNYVIGTPLKGKELSSFGTVGLFTVPSNSKNKEAAIEFVKEITSTEGQKEFNKLTNYIPTRKSATDIYDGNEEMKKFVEITEYTKPGVTSPVARTIMPRIQAEISAMLEGTKTPQAAADDAVKSIEDEMKK
ncbi:sugar ABC transporter substrate-binding protein [Paenibacillus marinisediminis]